MAKLDYNDLHHKTIFDFCKSQKTIDDIIVVGRDTYMAELKRRPVLNALHLIEYAQLSSNGALEKAVREQYKQELADFYNE